MTQATAYDLDTPAFRAGAMLGEAAACGFVLGGAAAFAAAFVAGAIAGAANLLVVLAAYGWLCAGLGSGVGCSIGLLVGVALYPLVRCGEPRLGTRGVARLVPAVALGITMPIAFAVGSLGNAAWFFGLAAIIALLTLLGAHVIARRYLRRAEVAHLH
jgi:hypothetical protein